MTSRLRLPPVPLAIFLAAVIGTLVAVSVMLVQSIGWFTASWNTHDLLRDKIALMLNALEEQVHAELTPARDQIGSLSEILVSGTIDPQDRHAVEMLLLGAAATTPQVTRLVMLGTDLLAAGAERRNDQIFVIDKRAGTELRQQYATTEADRPGGASLMEPIYLGNRRQSALALRQPVVRDGHLLGVLVSELAVNELSEFVGSLDNGTYGTHAFILYGRDRVLADAAMTQRLQALSPEHPLPALTEVGDKVLGAPWKPYKSPFATPPDVDVRLASAAGQQWLILLRRIHEPGLPDLTAGLYMPMSDIGEEVTRLHWSLAAGVAVLLGSLGAAALLGRFIARPVRQNADRSAAIGRFEIDEVRFLPRSVIRELDDQNRAFNAMLVSLRWFGTYVPNSLVRRLVTRGDPSGITSSERVATVMFTDIVDFTGLAERLTAAETASFLNAHFSIVTACIEREGGTVDKYIGDAVMAFWNAPDDQADHADRSCHAALAIRAAIATENQARVTRGEPPIRLRIGIHTGPVVVGNIGAPGRVNYTVVGATVNLAQRLEAVGKKLGPASSEVSIQVSSATISAAIAPAQTSSAGTFRPNGRGRVVEIRQLI
jgi:adenylate cyclase